MPTPQETTINKLNYIIANYDSEQAAQDAAILASFPTDTATGAIVSFPDGADGIPVKSLSVAITPVQSGSGDPSPDNIRPITGWTGAKVTRTGKNLFDGNWRNGYLDISNGEFVSNVNWRTTDFIPCKENTAYSFSGLNTTTGFYTGYILYYGANGFIGYASPAVTRVTPAGCTSFAFYTSAVSVSGADEVQIEENSSVSAYEPFGTTYSISFSSAGTVYGGTLDVKNGKLRVTHKKITYVGGEDESFTYNSSYGGFRTSISDANIDGIPSEQLLSNRFVGATGRGAAGNGYVIRSYIDVSAYTYIFLCGTGLTTEADFKTWLQTNNTDVVYPLATPIEYDLTPAEVTTLLGQNNIWSDTGNTNCTYRADVGLYIAKKIAEA